MKDLLQGKKLSLQADTLLYPHLPFPLRYPLLARVTEPDGLLVWSDMAIAMFLTRKSFFCLSKIHSPSDLQALKIPHPHSREKGTRKDNFPSFDVIQEDMCEQMKTKSL